MLNLTKCAGDGPVWEFEQIGNRRIGAPRPLALRLAELALDFAGYLALANRLALVVHVFAAGERELDLGVRAREIHPRRDQGQAALVGLADQTLDLGSIEWEPARAP